MDSKTLAERIRLRADDIAGAIRGLDIDSGPCMAYGVPPVETPASARMDERHKIARWVSQFDAVSVLGRRTVSTITVESAMTNLAARIANGEYTKEGDNG